MYACNEVNDLQEKQNTVIKRIKNNFRHKNAQYGIFINKLAIQNNNNKTTITQEKAHSNVIYITKKARYQFWHFSKTKREKKERYYIKRFRVIIQNQQKKA